jgi:hypothetical protein
VLGWPRLVAGSLAQWRLPDGALWLLLLGLGLLAARVPAWTPTAWTLTAVTLVGYSMQGVGVVQSLLLARGFPPYLAAVVIVFLVVMAAPAFLALAACVGVSDVWLDYRRLEHSPPGEKS